MIKTKEKKIIAIVGPKNAGKTRLIEKYGPLLKKQAGWDIGTVKCAYKPVRFDEGEYSYDVARHLKAGITTTVFKSSLHSVKIIEGSIALRKIIESMDGVDLVFIEGQLEDVVGYPQLAVINDETDIDNYENSYTVGITSLNNKLQCKHPRYRNFYSLLPVITSKSFPLLPGLNCGHCGNSSCNDMMEALIKGSQDLEDCEPRRMEKADFKLKVDGEPVQCVEFVRDIITGSINGMLMNLKGIDRGFTSIELAYSNTEKNEGSKKEKKMK